MVSVANRDPCHCSAEIEFKILCGLSINIKGALTPEIVNSDAFGPVICISEMLERISTCRVRIFDGEMSSWLFPYHKGSVTDYWFSSRM